MEKLGNNVWVMTEKREVISTGHMSQNADDFRTLPSKLVDDDQILYKMKTPADSTDITRPHHLMCLRQNSRNIDIESLRRGDRLNRRTALKRRRIILNMAINLGFTFFTAILVCIGFWHVQASTLRLQSGSYALTVEDIAQQHCQPCADVMTALTNGYHGRFVPSMYDLRELFHEESNDEGQRMCCTKTPQQVLALVDLVSS